MKVLGHMERAQFMKTQANSFQKFPNGLQLMKYLHSKYGHDHQSEMMRSATYHQQTPGDSQSNITVFDGHVDKSFVHTAWFVPLTVRRFYTFIAVPSTWAIPQDSESDVQYSSWMSTMSAQDTTKLETFKDNFSRLAKVFMKDSDIKILMHCWIFPVLSCKLLLPCNHYSKGFQYGRPMHIEGSTNCLSYG